MRLVAKFGNVFGTTPRVAQGVAAGLKISSRRADPDFERGTYETPIQEAIASNLSEGDVFYDVGANIGFFSLIAARCVGLLGQVYAYEPVPGNVATIERNRKLNEIKTIRIFSQAVGAATGSAELLLARHRGGATLANVSVPPDMSGRLWVSMTTLDDSAIEHSLRPPTLVKIDVEGAEADVLRGMAMTLRTYRPKIICEVDDATKAGVDRKAREILALMAAAGYVVSSLPAAYANGGWQVEHMFAQPLAM